MAAGGIFLFKVAPKYKNGQPVMLEPWMSTALAIASNSKELAITEAQKVRFAFRERKRGIPYFIQKFGHYSGPTVILALETMGGVQLSQQHVSDAAPGAQPRGQPGQNQMDGVRDTSGFQKEGDAGLDPNVDPYYGAPAEGAYTDLVNNHGAMTEVRRPPGG
jgi:hypothetical protein